MLPETLRWIGEVEGYLELIDQRLLPVREERFECRSVEDVYQAIFNLVVRGAPAIGVTAAFGAVIAAREGRSGDECMEKLRSGGSYLKGSRPTAVNLGWAIDRMVKFGEGISDKGRDEFLVELLGEARRIDEEDRRMCRQIGDNGKGFIEDGMGVLTHCNAGSLATVHYGTALAVIYRAWEDGRRFEVFADETRPVLQGARLTYWELHRAGVKAKLICDDMAGYAMQLGKVNMVITGADRIAGNGDVANKIGTYSLAVLAQKHGLPFYVAAPVSTFDFNLSSGGDIPIEERSGDEIKWIGKTLITVEDAEVWSPAFDVTPGELVTGIITDRGVIEKPDAEKVAEHFKSDRQ